MVDAALSFGLSYDGLGFGHQKGVGRQLDVVRRSMHKVREISPEMVS